MATLGRINIDEIDVKRKTHSYILHHFHNPILRLCIDLRTLHIRVHAICRNDGSRYNKILNSMEAIDS